MASREMCELRFSLKNETKVIKKIIPKLSTLSYRCRCLEHKNVLSRNQAAIELGASISFF